jgi:hypothetical protein
LSILFFQKGKDPLLHNIVEANLACDQLFDPRPEPQEPQDAHDHMQRFLVVSSKVLSNLEEQGIGPFQFDFLQHKHIHIDVCYFSPSRNVHDRSLRTHTRTHAIALFNIDCMPASSVENNIDTDAGCKFHHGCRREELQNVKLECQAFGGKLIAYHAIYGYLTGGHVQESKVHTLIFTWLG